MNEYGWYGMVGTLFWCMIAGAFTLTAAPNWGLRIAALLATLLSTAPPAVALMAHFAGVCP